MPEWLRRTWRQITGKGPVNQSSASKAPSPPTLRDRWTVHGVYFDTTGWRLTEASPASMMWSGDLGGTMTLTREPIVPPVTPRRIDLDIERRQYRARGAAAGGGLVSVEPVALPDGRVVIEAITKRPVGLGFGFDATLSVDDDEHEFTVRITADERFTGVRESVVNAQMWQLGEMTVEAVNRMPLDRTTGSRPVPGIAADPYDAAFDDDGVYGACDDPRLDALMPEHPLSVIRSTLRQIRASWVSDTPPRTDASVHTGMPVSAGPRIMLSVPVFREIYWAHGRNDVLEPELQTAIAAADSSGDGKNPEVARLLMMLGLVQHNSSNPLKARVAFQRAVEILTAAHGADHRDVGVALSLLGRTQASLGRTLEAERSLRRAVKILENSEHSEGPLLLAAGQLCGLLSTGDNVADAAPFITLAQDLMAKHPLTEGVGLLRELVGGAPPVVIAKTTFVQARR